jgi:hypothetical protein
MAWEFLKITIGTGVIPPNTWPEVRPDEYDSDLSWDEESGDWTLTVTGGGRYKQQLIVIGQGDANQGVVYFGEI